MTQAKKLREFMTKIFGGVNLLLYLCTTNLIKQVMVTLYPTDYVIFDRANDHVIQWESNGDMVIFGDKTEAEADCRGNEEVIACTELPLHHQEKLKKQIEKYNQLN